MIGAEDLMTTQGCAACSQLAAKGLLEPMLHKISGDMRCGDQSRSQGKLTDAKDALPDHEAELIVWSVYRAHDSKL